MELQTAFLDIDSAVRGLSRLEFTLRLLPLAICVLCILYIVGNAAYKRLSGKSQLPCLAAPSKVVKTLRTVTFVGSLALVCLNVVELLEWKGEWRWEWLLLTGGDLAVFVYACTMSLLFLNARRRDAPITLVLFMEFLVHVYHPLLDIALFPSSPSEVQWSGSGEEKREMARVCLLAVIGVLIPLVTPNVPVSAEATTNKEETASPLSSYLYLFLDSVVWKAYTKPDSNSEDDIPPLCSYDRMENILSSPHTRKCFKPERCLLWNLAAWLWKEYALFCLLLTVKVLAGFLAPLAINRLLTYMESSGHENDSVRPWVWIVAMFIGPFVAGLAGVRYDFIRRATFVRVEGLLSQQIFERVLRLRPFTSTSDAVDDALKSDKSSTKTQSTNSVGKINTLVTVDVENIAEASSFITLVWEIPLEAAISCFFLYKILDWSAIVCVAVIVLCFPLPGLVAKLIKETQVERMKKTDERVHGVTEVMSVLRMIKLFAWEDKMKEVLDAKRGEELRWVKKGMLLQLCINGMNYLIPLIALVATFASYTTIFRKALTASTVFSALPVIEKLRMQLHLAFWQIPITVKGKVSMDRVDDFLRKSDILNEKAKTFNAQAETDDRIGFGDATFRWSGPSSPSDVSFRLHIKGDLNFKRGEINLITGPTASGKTMMLHALLDELWFEGSWCNLPKEGGVAFAAQESWVLNKTIQENILFGRPMDRMRYEKVLYQCGLVQDMELFEAGDKTEVGEKGLTLSGGQKARISLARALYSEAKTLLLDDILAALDVHTAKWIVDECLCGDLIPGRTVILATHNIALAVPVAHFVVSLGVDGTVISQGSTSDVLLTNTTHFKIAGDDSATNEESNDKSETEHAGSSGKLIVAEDVATGHVRWHALKMYLSAFGGPFSWAVILILMLNVSLSMVLQIWFLGFWARQYEGSGQVHNTLLIGAYLCLCVVPLLFYVLASVIFFRGNVRASRRIYNKLIVSMLKATFRWLDETPTSRVITRCTQDVAAIDGKIPQQMLGMIDTVYYLLCRLGGFIVISPIFIFPSLIVGAIGAWCGQVYVSAQLPLKRGMSNARAPLLAHLGASITGGTTIRAYGAQETFRHEYISRTDDWIRRARVFHNLECWIWIRMHTNTALLPSALAAYIFFGWTQKDASDAGFSLNMAVAFVNGFLYTVSLFNQFEVSCNSLERVKDYLEIEHEQGPSEMGKPPAYWPSSGNLQVDGLSSRYSSDGPEILHNVSFSVKTGERVGVVGRTGSGKSTLTLSLLRGIITRGSVRYDNIETSSINLDALRANITIIPQQPEMISGTLRYNLDPFGQHDDATLNDALRAGGFFSQQGESEAKYKLALDSEISGGGSSLSVGQRQIVALSRAILRRSKLLILDEATSSIDHATDNIIQTSIRQELNDTTLIIVAHRLQTIMDADRVMVLSAGHLEEYDTPANLLKNPNGHFRRLVDGSEDREMLLSLVQKAS